MKRRSIAQAGLSIFAGPGALALAGAWSIALATPYLGPLFGLPAATGEWLEIVFHIGVGLPLLVGAVAVDLCGARRHNTGAESTEAARWLVLAAGIALTSAHWFTIPALDQGHPTWTRLIAHLMPGLIATASAAAAFTRRRRARERPRQTPPPAEVD